MRWDENKQQQNTGDIQFTQINLFLFSFPHDCLRRFCSRLVQCPTIPAATTIYICDPILGMFANGFDDQLMNLPKNVFFIFIFVRKVLVTALTWTCGAVERAYITACETSSAFRNGIFSSNSINSGLNISVLTAPGLMLCIRICRREKNRKKLFLNFDTNSVWVVPTVTMTMHIHIHMVSREHAKLTQTQKRI